MNQTKELPSIDVLADLPANSVLSAGTRWTARTRVLRRADQIEYQASDGDQLLLVYSLSVDAGPQRYIAAFPASARWLAKLATTDAESDLRYNASVGA